MEEVLRLEEQGNVKEAHEQASELLNSTEEPSEKVKIYTFLGNISLQGENYQDAISEFSSARNIQEEISGLAEYETAKTTNLLAIAYWKCGQLDRAEALFREALGVFRMEQRDSLDVAKIICNLSIVQKERGNFEDAERLLLEGLRIQKTVLGEQHPDVALTLQDLGILFGCTGNMEKA